jgi:hypothetical protein
MTPHKAQCAFVFVCIHMSANIMHCALTYCILYIVFCMSKFINNISWLFPSIKWHLTRHSMHLFFTIHMTACIMHSAFNILNYAWVNSLIILVDFPIQKWHPTRPNVCLFYALCIMHYAINVPHYAWVNSLIILVDFSHQKWHLTRHSVHLFVMRPYVCIHYALCFMQLTYWILHE